MMIVTLLLGIFGLLALLVYAVVLVGEVVTEILRELRR